MAYNLQTLITILEQILDPKQTRWIVDENKPQLLSLLQKAASLQHVLENFPLTKIECLETQIRDAAHKAEDKIESHMLHRMLDHYKMKIQPKSLLKKMVYKLQQICNHKTKDMIESHMVHQNLSNPEGVIISFSISDLKQVMQRLDFVMEKAMKLIEEKATSSGVSFSRDASSKSIAGEDHLVQSKAVVGVDEASLQLMDRVMGMQSKLEIVPIVGMGGIGKTTLARKLYQDPAIVEHFKYLAWTTVSQEYNMKAILLSLLRCIIGKECDQHTRKESHELKDILYRSLYDRRYIVVLDDVWSIGFWDEIRKYLPDNNNGSRIVITTRETQVAEHANSHSKQHKMQLLNESESWDLLRQEVFGNEDDCPAAFERVGRDIATNCGGLPLAICVIGGLLSKANKSEDVWENVANDVRAAIAKSDGQFFDILSLSYNHLPSHLRPCFLYMGAFPEDYAIKASKLVRLWVAEGFLKSNGVKSLEEEAEDCLKALVDRNLVSVIAIWKPDGRGKQYGMHDLMRDLCLKKAEEQRFVHVGKKQGGAIRRVSIHPSNDDINLFYAMKSMSLARSFLSTGPRQSPEFSLRTSKILSPVFSALRLLRVLDLHDIEFIWYPTETLHILNLRYLAIYVVLGAQLPSDITRLCYLQTLVLYSMRGQCFHLPCEILQMAELRHVMVYNGRIKIESSDWGGFVLDKLQTFLPLDLNSSCEFVHKIPNVKKLGIEASLSIIDLYHLQKLETLRFTYYRHPFLPAVVSPSTLRLPLSLKKLSFIRCKIDGDFMSYLCELPNLEDLQLKNCEFQSGEPREWDATQQEFCRLKFLLLERVKLVKWGADETNFPRLRHLVIRRCPALEEIPSGIGEIPTLQTIELFGNCRPSLVASAKLIIEEQRDNGNDGLKLNSYAWHDFVSLWQWAEMGDSRSLNSSRS